MTRFRITCVVRDKNGVIQQVDLDNGEMHQVSDIINWIDNRIHEFFLLPQADVLRLLYMHHILQWVIHS
jgi:uncharacterized protein DUF3892